MAAISQVHLLKPVSNSLLAGAGLVTVALSFAAQNALSNIISGFFIVLFKPFGINDRLRFKETVTGVVEDITLRHTIIRDGENKRVIIPNSY
jgi:small conductance mechanosensitive channel